MEEHINSLVGTTIEKQTISMEKRITSEQWNRNDEQRIPQLRDCWTSVLTQATRIIYNRIGTTSRPDNRILHRAEKLFQAIKILKLHWRTLTRRHLYISRTHESEKRQRSYNQSVSKEDRNLQSII